MLLVEEMIKQYNPETTEEVKAALKEILQSIVLVGLSRSGFFNKASFYGGTALRIFYGLNRYSEDLYFTLNEKEENFNFEQYFKTINEVALSYGLELEISYKTKKIDTPIESAFAKLNTYQTLIKLKVNSNLTKYLHKDELMKVKFEVDCYPSFGFNVESKWLDNPEYASVNVLDLPSLFAGKIHACLCRNWKTRVKGRDFYDYVFFLAMGAKVNLVNLKAKLVQSNYIPEDYNLTIENLRALLTERFSNMDFTQAKEDVLPFVKDKTKLDIWGKEFFIEITKQLQ